MVTDEMIRNALLAFQSGDMDWSSQDEELMRFALEEALSAMPKPKPLTHLVWLQGRRAADDVEDYYEVARPGDKSVDGSDPFPVYADPPALEAALSAAEPVAWVYAPDLSKGSGGFGKEKGSVVMSLDGEWINVDTPLYAAPPVPSAAVKALRELHAAEHAKLGEMLLDKSEDGQSKANWQGGRVNGIGAAISSLSAQAQDVARDLPSEFEKWWDDAGHYVGGVVKMTYTQRKQLAWDAFYASANPAAPAKQEG